MLHELFRVPCGMAAGAVNSMALNFGEAQVLVTRRRMIAKGKSRMHAAIRELRQKIMNPTAVANLGNYEHAITEFDANVEKLINYAGPDAVPRGIDLIQVCMSILPPEAEMFVLMRVQDETDPEKFRADMETHIQRLIRSYTCSTTQRKFCQSWNQRR